MQYDKSGLGNKITVIRLKSDNFDCWVSCRAYDEIRLQMSNGDFGTHQARLVEVDPNRLDDIRSRGFVDFQKGYLDQCAWYYWQDGDCIVTGPMTSGLGLSED